MYRYRNPGWRVDIGQRTQRIHGLARGGLAAQRGDGIAAVLDGRCHISVSE